MTKLFEELSERHKTYKTNTLRAANEAFCADGVTISELNQLEALIDKNDLEGLKSLPLLLNPSNEAVHESPERAEAVGYLKQLIEITEICIDFIKNLLVDALNFIHKPEQGYFIGKEEAPEEKTENELYIGPFSRA